MPPIIPRPCLYIGDIGDNRSIRRSVTVYRLPEPDSATLAIRRARPIDSLSVRYEDGPQDAEALVVLKTGDMAIISKGRSGESKAYWIPADAWKAGRVVARAVWRVPISPSLFLRTLVTDAALSPDEQWLAIRTYRDILLFKRGKPTGLPDQFVVDCDIGGLDPQGEGITWWNDHTLLLTSEMTRWSAAPITLLECPVP